MECAVGARDRARLLDGRAEQFCKRSVLVVGVHGVPPLRVRRRRNAESVWRRMGECPQIRFGTDSVERVQGRSRVGARGVPTTSIVPANTAPAMRGRLSCTSAIRAIAQKLPVTSHVY